MKLYKWFQTSRQRDISSGIIWSSVSQVPVLKPMDLMVEVSPRRVFANAHTYHVNSISVNSDYETYMSADDLRINLWHLDITDRSFSILSQTISASPERSCTQCWRLKAGGDLLKPQDRCNKCTHQNKDACTCSVISLCLHAHTHTMPVPSCCIKTQCWGRGILFLRSENVA